MSDFTLELIGGETRTLADWGVSAATLRLGSGEVDRLALVTREELAATPQWADSPAVLRLGAAVIFAGTIKPGKGVGMPGERTRSYEMVSEQWFLAHLPFTQNWRTYDDPSPIAYGRSFLFLNGRGTADEIRAAVQRGIDSLPVPAQIQIGSIDAQILLPPQKVENKTCSQVIAACLRRTIDGVGWMDYTASPHPAFSARRHASLDTLTLTPGMAGDGTPQLTAQRNAEPPLVLAPAGPKTLQVQECFETKIPFVRVILKRQTPKVEAGTDAGADDPVAFWRNGPDSFTRVVWPTDYFAGTGSEAGGLNVYIDWDPAFTEIEAANVAHYVYDAANAVAWQGEVTLALARPLFTLRPGMRLNVAGQNPAWATMAALVQSVSYDLFHGTTTARFGPPNQLGFSDYAELIKYWAGVRPSTRETDEQATGQSGGENFGFDKKQQEDKDRFKDFKELPVVYQEPGGGVTRKQGVFLVKAAVPAPDDAGSSVVAGSEFVAVATAAGPPTTYTVSLKAQPDTGVRYLSYSDGDGLPTLVPEIEFGTSVSGVLYAYGFAARYIAPI